MQKDIEALEDEGPAAELGLDLPEMYPMSSRSVTSGNAADVDTDVVAQQRWLTVWLNLCLACLLMCSITCSCATLFSHKCLSTGMLVQWLPA